MCKIFVRLKILGIPDEKIVRGVYNLVRFCRKNVRNLNNLHERCAKYLLIEDLQTVEGLANCRCLTGNRELAVSDENLQ